jgi:hypothetical protein
VLDVGVMILPAPFMSITFFSDMTQRQWKSMPDVSEAHCVFGIESSEAEKNLIG